MADRAVRFTPRAVKDLKALARSVQEEILGDPAVLSARADLPPPPEVKKLKGASGYYRLRSGGFRSVFKLDADSVMVLRVVDRKELERSLAHLWH
ncbi:MAG: type II toxin-antitoxin system RelE/ParE family toxin [Elusimicrobia bacterium]|nr:type II toxin-antitoxin system RelE/ParE family toxin [Elusimicrobiota bacterium]